MAVARVVSFEGVDGERVAAMQAQIGEGGPPDGVPAREIVMLHDPETETAIVVIFFDSEEDYAQGDEVLSAMPGDETPGRRTSVRKHDVVVRMTA